jgi:hypothetical protein
VVAIRVASMCSNPERFIDEGLAELLSGRSVTRRTATLDVETQALLTVGPDRPTPFTSRTFFSSST